MQISAILFSTYFDINKKCSKSAFKNSEGLCDSEYWKMAAKNSAVPSYE